MEPWGIPEVWDLILTARSCVCLKWSFRCTSPKAIPTWGCHQASMLVHDLARCHLTALWDEYVYILEEINGGHLGIGKREIVNCMRATLEGHWRVLEAESLLYPKKSSGLERWTKSFGLDLRDHVGEWLRECSCVGGQCWQLHYSMCPV